MRKLITLYCVLCLTLIGQAQVAKTINISSAGTLSTTLTTNELSSVTNLTITGTIDARDFKTMRDNMPELAVLDMSGVTIGSYSGTGGTSFNYNSTSYPANTTPEFAFCNSSYNSKLKSINLPLSLAAIGSWTFEFCESLNQITIPNTVTSIGTYAFCDCISLTGTFTIPTSLTFFGDFSFYRCSGLTDFTVSTENPNFSVLNGVLFDKTQTTLIECLGANRFNYTIPSTVTCIGFASFETCTELTNITIPNSVTRISMASFSDCYKLKSLSIPNSVIDIETNAFGGCNSLTSIYAYSVLPTDLSKTINVFKNVDKVNCILYVPIGSKASYQAADQWKDFMSIVEMTTALQTIDNASISLYPNPIIDELSITGVAGTAIIEIFDINGKILSANKLNNNKSILIENLPKGLYLVKIITDEGTVERKLIKK